MKVPAPPIKLWVDEIIAVEKYVHGTNAAYEKIGYGIPSLGIFASSPNTIEKMIIEKRGLISAHVKPKTDCL